MKVGSSMIEADAILSRAVDAYGAALGERLLAAYALGSLAHGGFSPLVSDIDLAVILADPVQPNDGDTIGAVAETQKRAGSALAERLSVFWGTPLTLRGQAEGGRFTTSTTTSIASPRPTSARSFVASNSGVNACRPRSAPDSSACTDTMLDVSSLN
jgi:hypothetical protein